MASSRGPGPVLLEAAARPQVCAARCDAGVCSEARDGGRGGGREGGSRHGDAWSARANAPGAPSKSHVEPGHWVPVGGARAPPSGGGRWPDPGDTGLRSCEFRRHRAVCRTVLSSKAASRGPQQRGCPPAHLAVGHSARLVSWEQGGCAGAGARLRGSRAAGGHAARPPRPRPSLLARPQAVPSGTCHSGCTWQVPLTQEGLGRGAAAPAGLPPRGSRKRLVQRPPFLRDAFSLRGKSRTRCRPFRRASGRSEAHCRRKEFGRAGGPAGRAGALPGPKSRGRRATPRAPPASSLPSSHRLNDLGRKSFLVH